MTKAVDMVREFHEKYGAPVRNTPDADVPEKKLRIDLIWEEFLELVYALGFELDYPTSFSAVIGEQADTVEVADALGDLLYVIYGAALTFGIDLDGVVEEIHRSNMSKLGEDGKPIMREDGKVLKGPDFFRPNIKKVLGLDDSRCGCVECYETSMLEVLDGPLAVYQSLKYRTFDAKCTECGDGGCPKALFHGDLCISAEAVK